MNHALVFSLQKGAWVRCFVLLDKLMLVFLDKSEPATGAGARKILLVGAG